MKKKLTVFITHFSPLERYPPIMNLLDYFGKNATEHFVILTTDNNSGTLKTYTNNSKNITIKRSRAIVPDSLFRIFSYLSFYIKSLFLLIKYKPKNVIYFETISSWPALMYKKIRGGKVNLFVHYHEYTSLQEYESNMWLVKKMHSMEAEMYKNSYEWISHTNEIRLKKFRVDHHLENDPENIFHQMANYPSIKWGTVKHGSINNEKIRLIYVGSLGYDSMYLQETIDWVLNNRAFLTLDIYAYNIDQKSRQLLASIKDAAITYKNGCDYKELPAILSMYDVGLVLYKPTTQNWVDNAPNKVFEYLACGLDVWFPDEMTYTLLLARHKVFPKIVPINFKNLNDFNFRLSVQRQGLQFAPTPFYYENVYTDIYKKLQEA